MANCIKFRVIAPFKRLLWISIAGVALSAISAAGAATRTDEVSPQVWLGYITSYRFNEKYSLWNDWHIVPTSFFVSRHGLTRHLSQQVSMSGGYAWGFLPTPGSSH